MTIRIGKYQIQIQNREEVIDKREQATGLPWSMAFFTNGHKCAACLRNKIIFSFGVQVSNETGLHQYQQGYWKEIRKRIVFHYKKEHPEYKITRLREGPK